MGFVMEQPAIPVKKIVSAGSRSSPAPRRFSEGWNSALQGGKLWICNRASTLSAISVMVRFMWASHQTLPARVYEHREGLVDGFTRRYGLKRLVWYEQHETMEAAITREKQMKAWQRAWKIREIEGFNPTWDDLYETLNQ